MWTVCVFCTLLSALVPIADAINAVITPEYEVFVSKGENITLHCTLLDLNSSTHTAEDILWYKDSVLLPSKLSHPVSLNASQLIVVNSTFEDSGIYGCGFPEDTYREWELHMVTVALPPAKVQNLTCRSHDVENIYCTWEEGAVETNIRNTHKAQFKYYGKEELHPVNQDSEYSCSFEITLNTDVSVQVTSTNLLGSAMAEVTFDPLTEVTPHEPERVAAAPHSENGKSVLRVTWDFPSEWKNYYSLEYRVRYRSEGSNETKEKMVSGFKSTLLEDLNPFTTYEIEVAAKSPVASDLYWGEPGRTSATTLEGSPFGSVSGLSLLSETESIQTGLRHVHLQWQEPPRSQWGSKSISYVVHLIPEDESHGHSMENYITNASLPSELIHDVSKYQTYSVKIKPVNECGDGPETVFQNAIPDRTSVPGKPTDLNVTLMESNALHIRWQPPQNPNGLIYYYEVIVTGNAVLSSNESNVLEEGSHKTRTQSHVIQVPLNCTELTEKGHPVEVLVAATTKNYNNHFFQGSYSKFTQDGVCKKKEEPSFIFISIFIPCIIIISCIVALLIWNVFKDTCVEPPEPYIPKSINKGGHIGIGNIPSIIVTPEKERFDELKPRREISNNSVDVIRGQQTISNPLYQDPHSIQPENALKRIISHDSGMWESPGSHCGAGMEFYNQGFVEHSTDGLHEPIRSICRRNVSMGESDGVSSLWHQSGIANASEDRGTEVMVKEGAIIMGQRPTCSSADELLSPDPNFKVKSTSRNVSVGESDEVSSLWHQSGIANASEDRGTEVMVKEGAIIMGQRPTCSSADELLSPDPNFKVKSTSRNVSVGESDEVSSLWHQSGIANASEDRGTEVMVKEGAIIMGQRPTSSSADELLSPDPNCKVLASLPLSSQSSDFSSPYVKTTVGQDERMQTDEENEDADDFENDCPFDDGDSNSGYLQQYQLGSPSSLTAEVPPYMKMTPISPPPVSSCVPNGYVSTQSLPCPHKRITGDLHDQKSSVSEDYSTMVDSQGSEDNLKQNKIPIVKKITETPEIYIKHTSLPSTDVNYRNDYPDFNLTVPLGPTPERPKQESGGYVQHKDTSISSL